MSEKNIESDVEKTIDKVIDDFEKNVNSEKDLSVILLKGHLLIEYYLNYLIIILHDTNIRTDKLSFFEKIKILEKDNCFNKKNVLTCLYKLNDVRNDLSHNLNYCVLESEIDSIGFNLGREYIIKKFDFNLNNSSELRELFTWVIIKVLLSTSLPIISFVTKEKYKVKSEISVPKALPEVGKTVLNEAK